MASTYGIAFGPSPGPDRRRKYAILVAGWPIHRVFRRRKAEKDFRERRLSSDAVGSSDFERRAHAGGGWNLELCRRRHLLVWRPVAPDARAGCGRIGYASNES